jgi:hypothetical protein
MIDTHNNPHSSPRGFWLPMPAGDRSVCPLACGGVNSNLLRFGSPLPGRAAWGLEIAGRMGEERNHDGAD